MIYGEMDKARPLVERAIKHNAKPQFMVTLGLINARSPWDTEEQRLDNLRRATQDFELATRKDLTLAVAHMNLGVLLMNHSEDFDGAEAAFRRAIEINPNYARAHYNLGVLLEDHRKDFDGAEAAYRRAIEIDPNYALAHNSLAKLLKNHK